MRWTTKVIYFDVETSEIISKWEAKDNYITIKKEKDVKLDKKAFRGVITHIYHCRRNSAKQIRINF